MRLGSICLNEGFNVFCEMREFNDLKLRGEKQMEDEKRENPEIMAYEESRVKNGTADHLEAVADIIFKQVQYAEERRWWDGIKNNYR